MGFLSNLSGGSSRRDLRVAQGQADQALQQGFDQSNQRYDQASGMLDPYARSGQQGQEFYNNLLGLNGADARASSQGIITSDPQWSGKFAADSNAMLRNMNARGQGAGGAAALAGQRVLSQNYGNAMDRYMNLGQQGLQATGAQADIRRQQGDNAYGYGATRAANYQQMGNALAGTRSTGINNITGLVGTAINAYAVANGMPPSMPTKK
jgi:hypothetical protein